MAPKTHKNSHPNSIHTNFPNKFIYGAKVGGKTDGIGEEGTN
jgi:hypothetical protein